MNASLSDLSGLPPIPSSATEARRVLENINLEIEGKSIIISVTDVIKKQNSSMGVVSTDNILCAIDEANRYAEFWLSYSEEDKEQKPIKKESVISLTEEERDF